MANSSDPVRAHSMPPVPKIKLLGTTWYRRRWPYWARRTGLAAAYLVFFMIVGIGVAAVVSVIVTDAKGIWLGVFLSLAVTAVLWSFYVAFRQFVAENRRFRLGVAALTEPGGYKASRDRRAATAGGLGLGIGAYGGSALAGGLLIVGQLFVIGWVGYMVAISFRRYLTPEEFEAVMRVEEWNRRNSQAS